MNCALWLNRRKVYSADEIPDNLDLAALCGYFAAGSLVPWLKSHGGESYAKELEKLSPNDPALKEKLGGIFGGQPLAYKQFGSGAKSVPFASGISSSAVSSGIFGSYGSGIPLWKLKLMGSFNFSSYSFTSYLLNIGFGGALGGSYSFSSFSGGSFGLYGYEWEWEWERFLASFGSFYGTSFVYGSFAYALGVFFAQKYGSWRSGYGSFKGFGGLFGSWDMRRFGSFYGSFALKNGQNAFMDSDEYDRILMECVFGCKLNGYGYGIHNI